MNVQEEPQVGQIEAHANEVNTRRLRSRLRLAQPFPNFQLVLPSTKWALNVQLHGLIEQEPSMTTMQSQPFSPNPFPLFLPFLPKRAAAPMAPSHV
ncbi:hypothetical protein LP415_13660 [Polaromonas sp. P1(28)-8]|nr:hypothetical protein LP415_13660 [Polaromonas sp. P1(28)-8]